MPSVILNGVTYPDNCMLNGGHRTNLFPLLGDFVAQAGIYSTQFGTALTTAQQWAISMTVVSGGLYGAKFYADAANTSAQVAAAAAASAINAPASNGTSTSSLTINPGAQSLTTQTGKGWVQGQFVVVTTSPTQWMIGYVNSYNSGTGALSLTATQTNGAGTFSAWTIALATPVPSGASQPITGLSAGTAAPFRLIAIDAAGNVVGILDSRALQRAIVAGRHAAANL